MQCAPATKGPRQLGNTILRHEANWLISPVDRRFLVHARNDVPWLCAQLRAALAGWTETQEAHQAALARDVVSLEEIEAAIRDWPNQTEALGPIRQLVIEEEAPYLAEHLHHALQLLEPEMVDCSNCHGTGRIVTKSVGMGEYHCPSCQNGKVPKRML